VNVPSNSLWRETLANLVGRFWIAALGFICIPIYLRYLGAEAYGMVGFYTVLLATLSVADLGLGITVNREMARLSAQPGGRAEQRDVLRTLEVVHWVTALSVGFLLALIAPVVASNWVRVEQLSPAAVSRAIRLMGFIIAMQLPFAFYQGALFGLRRHNLVNGVLIAGGTIRNAGAVAAVIMTPTLEAFFLSQAVVALLQTSLIAYMVWRRLRLEHHHPHFRADILRRIWRFSTGMAANSLVGLGFTQLDKLVLSRMLSLVQFGYYTLAGTIASSIWVIIGPINAVLFPRFAQLVELHDQRALAELYHTGAQFMAVTLLPVSIALALFSRTIIGIWTQNPVVADQAHLVASLLVIGTALNGLVTVASQLQAAAGWPQLILYSNLVGAIVLIPAMAWAAIRFGPIGASAVWVVLNLGYVFVMIPIMHRRLLKKEMLRWYAHDVGLPLCGALSIGLVSVALQPAEVSTLGAIVYIGLTWLAMTAAAALLAARVRARAALALVRLREAY
jgi:O-antigen/teichoic acid export membrane protein